MLHLFGRQSFNKAKSLVIGNAIKHETIMPLVSHVRSLHTSSTMRNGEFELKDPTSPDEVVQVWFTDRDGVRHDIKGKVGDNLMYLAHRYQDTIPSIYLEGACEASLACSTCHVILEPQFYEKLAEPEEEEEDMLDLAACLTDTSRLGCQIILSKELDGLEVKLPPYSANFYVDGHVPQPH